MREEAQHQAKETMRENNQLKRHLAEARQELKLEQKRGDNNYNNCLLIIILV